MLSLKAAQLETPLGIMLVIADEEALLFLDFVDRHSIARINQKLSTATLGSNVGPWERDGRWESSASNLFIHEETCHLSRLERKIKRLRMTKKALITPGENDLLRSIEGELAAYFEGSLRCFKTPFSVIGSPFQQAAWNVLLQLPYGTTKSYAEQAVALGNPTAVRAVANANGANQLAIVIPCHRIISTGGGLGGYGSGVSRKAWLLENEKMNS